VKPDILSTEKNALEKEEGVRGHAPHHVAAFGNGNNDRLLLKDSVMSDYRDFDVQSVLR
jgi:hypothetical protein